MKIVIEMAPIEQSLSFVPTRVATETATVLLLMIRSVVRHRHAVDVSTVPNPAGAGVLFRVLVDPTDKGKVIGKQGRTAQSIRVILGAIGKENGEQYLLDLDGFAMNLKNGKA